MKLMIRHQAGAIYHVKLTNHTADQEEARLLGREYGQYRQWVQSLYGSNAQGARAETRRPSH